MVARKIIKKGILIGREALDNRSMLDLRRPLERGIMKERSEKDQEAVAWKSQTSNQPRRHQAKSKTKSKCARWSACRRRPRVSRQNLRNTGRNRDSVMLVSEPFAVAYGLKRCCTPWVIDIGAGTADFVSCRGVYPTEDDQRTLSAAGDSIDEIVRKTGPRTPPDAQFSCT